MNKYKRMVLYLTENCHLGCESCFIKNKTVKSMNLDVAEAAIDMFMKMDTPIDADVLPVELFGGDPLLESSKFEPVVEFYQKRQKKIGKKLRFETESHKFNMPESFRKAQNKEHIRFGNTILREGDDTGWRYCCPNGKAAEQTISECEENCADESKKQKVITRIPLRPSNLKIKELVEEHLEKGEQRISFFPVISDEEWDKHFHFAVFKKELKKLADWYIDSARRGEILPLTMTNRMILQYEAVKHGASRPENPCNNRTLVVDTEGNILGCRHQLNTDTWVLGNVYKGINKIRLASYDSYTFSAFQGCNSCNAKMVCPGPCEANIRDYGHDLYFPIKAHCIFTKAHFEAACYIYHTLDMEDNTAFRDLISGYSNVNFNRE